MSARTDASPVAVAVATTLSFGNSIGARCLPVVRAVRGLAWGLDGWRAARAADGAREATMDRLVTRLGWRRDALPTPDGWAGSPDLLAALADEVLTLKPCNVVEFGSGLSTLVIARSLELNQAHTATFVSFDHNEGFAHLTRRRLAALSLSADVRTVPLVDAERWGCSGDWYLADNLPDQIDLLVIDGPPAWLNEGSRGAAGPALFHRMRDGGVILLDDADRDGERQNAARWMRDYPWIRFDYVPSHKGLLRGVVAR